MKIVFVHSGLEFDGHALRERPLGGTETALIGVSRELAKIAGNEVYVFTNTPRTAVFEGVAYFPLAQLAGWAAGKTIDVLLSIRQWVPFWLPLQARLRVYFSPDAYDQPFLHRVLEMPVTLDGKQHGLPVFAPRDVLPGVDRIFCVGQWQADTFVEKLGFPREKIVATGNAIFPENFAPLPRAQRAPGLVYSATPFRGLAELASYFPEIQRHDPAARLVVCSGLGVYSIAATEEQRLFGDLYRQLTALGAELHGSIRQPELAKIMAANLVYAYPNTFDETFCISVLEAQAAGLPVVTSRRAALAERITHGVDGILIDGHPSTTAYREAFLAAVHRLLNDAAEWERLSAAAIQTASRQTYPRLAASWQEHFTAALAASPAPRASLPLPTTTEVTHPKFPQKKMRLDPPTVAHLLKAALSRYGG